jgi:hypothetical protein
LSIFKLAEAALALAVDFSLIEVKGVVLPVGLTVVEAVVETVEEDEEAICVVDLAEREETS